MNINVQSKKSRSGNILNYIIISAMTSLSAVAQQTQAYRTEIFRDDIKSLEVRIEGEKLSTPFVALNGEQRIEIVFDALYRTGGRFAYSVVHCDADWKRSALIPLEYMTGFQSVAIDDYANSFNTTVSYVNYRLPFPNDNVQLTASGNYAVQIYEEDNPDEIVLTACFSVTEALIGIDASVGGNTDIDFNKGSQQLDFTLNQRGINIAYPQRDLKIFVCQNNDRNDVRSDLQPLLIRNRQLVYEHNRALIFEAGNEFRRIEFMTHRYNGMGVEHIAYYDPYYNVTLFPETKRAGKPYLYDQDQNGRFFVSCVSCQNPDTEADYYVVHFSLVSERMQGDVYICGDLFNNIIDDRNRMDYNAEHGAYEKAVLLKQGLYNYRYVCAESSLDGKSAKISSGKTEGNFFETENEYTIAVYYRPAGARYDRLIGVKNLNANRSQPRR